MREALIRYREWGANWVPRIVVACWIMLMVGSIVPMIVHAVRPELNQITALICATVGMVASFRYRHKYRDVPELHGLAILLQILAALVLR
jgi:hypothetical protein